MPFDSEELVALLRRYQAAVREAVGHLRRHDFSTTLLAIYRRGPLDREGRAYFEFHGNGCLVKLPDGRYVDFDFGFDERHAEARVDGLDPGFVQAYYEQLPGATSHPDLFRELTAGTAALVQAGVLVHPEADYLKFYFTADWHSPHPETYSSNAVPLDHLPDMLAQLDRFCYRLY